MWNDNNERVRLLLLLLIRRENRKHNNNIMYYNIIPVGVHAAADSWCSDSSTR